MKIKFGTTSKNINRAVCLSCTVGIVSYLCYFPLLITLDKAHDALLELSMPNATSNDVRSLLCGISSYDDCRCSVQASKNVSLKNCLTDNYLLYSRLFPIVSFILQAFLVRDLFTLSGKYTSIVIYGLWIMAVFIFVFIANGIYHSSCFQRIVIPILQTTGGILFSTLLMSDIKSYLDMAVSRSNHRNTRNNRTITHNEAFEEGTHDRLITWKKLL